MKRTLPLLGTLSALLLTTGLAMAGPGAAGHGHGEEAPAGTPGDPKKAARVVPITMKETDDGRMVYFPEKVEVRVGEQIRFVLKNAGKADHEFVLDTVENNAKHRIAMQKNPDMEHDDPNARRLAVSKGGEILWQFTKAGEFEYACLIPGHYEAGMKGTVVVK
ncbi:cupredoxin domain-containing protein [Microvirga terricola]|uniref:Cupredoxin family protein n=1 Tax=Microvirga terricola TaxID=2719797 RepID=A0ABX0VEJ2_9HYPH|nr:cupredoxin family protein [Microvirga terricola]NIX78257.1 cupredoxin family protein [Microvirga terricola]